MIFAAPKCVIVEIITVEEKSPSGLILPKKEEHHIGKVLHVGDGCSKCFDNRGPCYVYFRLYSATKITQHGKDYHSVPETSIFAIAEEL